MSPNDNAFTTTSKSINGGWGGEGWDGLWVGGGGCWVGGGVLLTSSSTD